MDRKLLSQLSQEQQIVYTAMMLPSNQIPNFPISEDVDSIGKTIKEMFDNSKLTKMYFDKNSKLHVA